ncbi:MAG: RNA polymerase factor sigma-32 [Deltaproteobacteria bacterium]|nr:RNA polymerase factor sigma-32 [Deltaproteobacteria bacterium]
MLFDGDTDFLDNPELVIDDDYGDDDDYKLPSEVLDPMLRVPIPREQGSVPQGPVGSSSLGSYIRDLRNSKLLTNAEETELAKRYLSGDKEAGKSLVTANLRLVVKIAMEFQSQWLNNIQDLIQEGNMGLLQALKKFDPSRGVKFGYYAAYWIKSYILKYIMDNWWLVKYGTTAPQRKLFFNLKKEQEKIIREGLDPVPELLAARLGVSENEVLEMAARFKSGNEISLDTPISPGGEESQVSIIPSHNDPADDILNDKQLREIVRTEVKRFRKNLDERENIILDKRLLNDDPLTLQELGEEFGITRERVRQLEERVKEKLQTFILKKLPHLKVM